MYGIDENMSKKLVDIYNKLTSLRTFEKRGQDGTSAIVKRSGAGWVQKEDRSGFELCGREFRFMCELWGRGFQGMPEPDEEFGVQGHPDTYQMEEIFYGLQLREVGEYWKIGGFEDEVMEAIMEPLNNLIQDFWETGAVHGDLHLGNILVGMNRYQEWELKIIDFGFSFWDGNDDRFDATVIKDQEDDRDRLIESLSELDLDQWFEI